VIEGEVSLDETVRVENVLDTLDVASLPDVTVDSLPAVDIGNQPTVSVGNQPTVDVTNQPIQTTDPSEPDHLNFEAISEDVSSEVTFGPWDASLAEGASIAVRSEQGNNLDVTVQWGLGDPTSTLIYDETTSGVSTLFTDMKKRGTSLAVRVKDTSGTTPAEAHVFVDLY
jgi:hypothetical protein